MDNKAEFIKRVAINGIAIEIDGYYNDDTPAGKYEWYDIFHRGICVNEGDPFEDMPTDEQLLVYAKNIQHEYADGVWTPIENRELR
jgi:hypothetical protein